MAVSSFHTQSLPDMSASGARFCAKKRSMMPLGAKTLAKSAICTSRSLSLAKG